MSSTAEVESSSQEQTYGAVGPFPGPDPTVLTTQALDKEISHLRELMEANAGRISLHLDAANEQMEDRFTLQITDIRRQVEAKFVEQDRAVQAALTAADKAVTALETATTQRMASLQELNENKFITYRTLLDSQADKVALALAAADKAVSAAFSSSKEAIFKAEMFNEKRFDILTKQIDELKTTVTFGTGRGNGLIAGWGFLVGGIGTFVAIITVIIMVTRH